MPINWKKARRRMLLAAGVSVLLAVGIFLTLFRIPFWLDAPDGFCYGRRLTVPVCRDAGPVRPEMPKDPEAMLPVYVVGHSWHTGLMLRMEDIPPDRWSRDIPREGVQAIEVGWGDEGFYRAKKYTIGLAAEALFLPTPSVIHAVLLEKPAEANFKWSDISVFWTDPEGYNRLLDFIDSTFAKDADGRLLNLGNGIYGKSTFFRAVGSFYFPKSCNSWVARALKEAGAPIWAGMSITSTNTLRQINMFGHEVRSVPGWKLLPN